MRFLRFAFAGPGAILFGPLLLLLSIEIAWVIDKLCGCLS